MKFIDIPADILSIRVKATRSASVELKDQPILSVLPFQNSPGEFEVRTIDHVFIVKPTREVDIRNLGYELSRGSSILAQFANPAADGSIELQIAFFTGECLEMDDIEIGVDEYVEKAATRMIGEFKGEKLYENLEKRFSFLHGGLKYFFLTAGPAIDDVLKQKSSDEESRKETEQIVAVQSESESDDESDESRQETTATGGEDTRKISFCVTGDGIRFVATENLLSDGKSVFIATRLTNVKRQPDRALRLAKGKLKFVDWTKTGQIQILARAQMSSLVENSDSYLRKWDEFGDLEGELLLKRAREVGTMDYCGVRSNRDGSTSVVITEASDSAFNFLTLNEVEEVEVVDEIPEYLKNPAMKFAEFAKMIQEEQESDDQERYKDKTNINKLNNLYINVFDFDNVSRRLTLAVENLSPSGTLVLSLSGEIAQIKRRMNARKAILEGRSVNPQLGLLIEENGRIAPTRSPSKIKPLSALVRSKVFPDNPPTVMQEKAIEVALSTPDIALIQGPPGTGKTTVIAAILERLNELADKSGSNLRGKVLLTGFQHDAVENMIDRLWLNGIPVPKFGKRSGSDVYDFDLFERRLEEWCAELSDELNTRIPAIKELQQESDIRNLCLQYCRIPTRTLATSLLNRIASLGGNILGEETLRKAATLAEKLSMDEVLNDESGSILEKVRSLPHRPESFLDDGPERATDAMVDLGGFLAEDELALLDKASLWCNEEGAPPFLKELAELKKKLLIRFTAPPFFRAEKHNDEVIALAQTAIERIRVAGFSARDKKSAALFEFLEELQSNPYGMIDTVSDYSFAFAATCQQSVNKQMQFQKGIKGKDSELKLEYDYVVVDEAARVSPRDLMIPMAQGKRIILVGDHRQLPHIIDEEVARMLENGEAWQDESDWLKTSMFQYLFSERLKALETKDSITRRVTLDRQYRMHPLLGEFVSRSFYERFDSTEKFGSGLPEASFAHNLPGTDNKPAVWLDVPWEKGQFERSGTSWTRASEATAISRQIRTWMNSAEGKHLSYGVISYYKAQAELVTKQLGSITDDGKKLRVGTVDSFQGMEFDVVFLSVVRTNRPDRKSRYKDRAREAASLFGHLCLSNRLNVSMSRQKKLLVVVGDAGLIKGDLAAEFIPGLVDFYNLCRTKGKVLKCQ